MGQLRRYDLCRQAVWVIRAETVKMNGGSSWETFAAAKLILVSAVMQTRPGLDQAKVEGMVNAFFEAEN